MKTTLDDVARASGVSKATASYVLNNKPASFGLSAETVRRVIAESRRLKYRPDLVAQALEEQKRMALSIVILSPWLHSQFSDFMVQVSHAVESAMTESKIHADYKLYRTGELKRTLSLAKCGKYDAVIVLGTNAADDAFLDKNRDGLGNVILLNRTRDGYACSFGNDETACAELAKRLVAAGYYERYVLSCGTELSRREELRVTGYRKVISRAGKNKFFENRIVNPDREGECLKQTLEQYGTNRVCYIFTQYFPAARMMNLAIRSGIEVPHGIGIVGYDQHSLLKDFLNPPLTTINPRIYEMTGQALALARSMKEGGKIAARITEAVFVEGGSAIFE